MKYIRLQNNVVCEIIPEIDAIFPEVPIEERYNAEFLANCIQVEDETPPIGYIYEGGVFLAPTEPESIPVEVIVENKVISIVEQIATLETVDQRILDAIAEKQT